MSELPDFSRIKRATAPTSALQPPKPPKYGVLVAVAGTALVIGVVIGFFIGRANSDGDKSEPKVRENREPVSVSNSGAGTGPVTKEGTKSTPPIPVPAPKEPPPTIVGKWETKDGSYLLTFRSDGWMTIEGCVAFGRGTGVEFAKARFQRDDTADGWRSAKLEIDEDKAVKFIGDVIRIHGPTAQCLPAYNIALNSRDGSSTRGFCPACIGENGHNHWQRSNWLAVE